VNCARGELIVDEALVEGIKSGQVAGAALDVFRSEPLKNSPYFELDNVLLSPHVAGSTNEAQEAIGIQLANQIRDYLKLGVVQNAVNMPSLTEEEYSDVAPYIDMAERLGRLLGHTAGSGASAERDAKGLGPGSVESISITYNGRLASLKTDLIRNAAIAGVLHGADGVNRINAFAAAAERGIRIQEDKREHIAGGTGATLRLVLHWSCKGVVGTDAQGDWTGLATVVHGNSPRLINYDGIDVEAELAGTLIVIRNHDVPGVIGRIGTIIGDHGVNIANFALGRATRSQYVPQGQALAVVQIDTQDNGHAAAAIEALRKVEAIASVRLVELGG